MDSLIFDVYPLVSVAFPAASPSSPTSISDSDSLPQSLPKPLMLQFDPLFTLVGVLLMLVVSSSSSSSTISPLVTF
jgi:hypothetical protein